MDVLPDVVKRFVTECADAIGCDRSFVASFQCLVACLRIGSRRVIRLKATWHEPAIIWAAIVGKSGTHKSPAIKAVMRPMMRTQADAEVAFQDAMRRYMQEKAQYEVNLEAWKSQQRKNAKKGDQDERDQAPWEPLEPVYERFIVCDITIEALADRLADQYDGVLLVRDDSPAGLEVSQSIREAGVATTVIGSPHGRRSQ